MYRLFSWEHSYFSGKTRAYLRYKQHFGGLGPGFEDVLATPELISGLLVPRTGSNTVPQLLTPEGELVHDTCEIFDLVEGRHPEPAVRPPPERAPRQCLASYLIELLADEWLLVPAFWQRWFFSEDGRSPSHRGFNEQQWGAVLAPGASGPERRAAGAAFFEAAFGISKSRSQPRGVYAGLAHLGVDAATEAAWQGSQHRLLGLLEEHFGRHDHLLGGAPGLADFALLGPLYAHLYRDAVAGFALRTHFPLVAEWVERSNGESDLNARSYRHPLYSLDASGALCARPATSDGGAWLSGDALPETLLPVLGVFFEEMWPVLCDAAGVLARFVASDAHEPGAELPSRSFTASPGFEALQTGEGPLTHAYEIGGVGGRRMVVPNQIWRLCRLEPILERCTASAGGRGAVEDLLARFPRGPELLGLGALLEGCRIDKRGGRLFSLPPG